MNLNQRIKIEFLKNHENQLSVNSFISTESLIHLMAELIDALNEVASSASIVIMI